MTENNSATWFDRFLLLIPTDDRPSSISFHHFLAAAAEYANPLYDASYGSQGTKKSVNATYSMTGTPGALANPTYLESGPAPIATTQLGNYATLDSNFEANYAFAPDEA